MELLSQAMDGWDESDIETFAKLMTRFADGVNNIVDERADSAAALQLNTEENVEN